MQRYQIWGRVSRRKPKGPPGPKFKPGKRIQVSYPYAAKGAEPSVVIEIGDGFTSALSGHIMYIIRVYNKSDPESYSVDNWRESVIEERTAEYVNSVKGLKHGA